MNIRNINVPALSLKAADARRTFDFGFQRATDYDALQVSNGRVLEKRGRVEIFRNRIIRVKA